MTHLWVLIIRELHLILAFEAEQRSKPATGLVLIASLGKITYRALMNKQ